MKIVKESLYEKFVEDSDPVEDLGIGMLNRIKGAYNKLLKAFEKTKQKDGGYEFQYANSNNWDSSDLLHGIQYSGNKIIFIFNYASVPNTDTSRNYRTKGTKKIINNITRKEYVIEWIKRAELDSVIDIESGSWINEYNSHLTFNINPNVIEHFKDYFFDKVNEEYLYEQFVEDSDPIRDMGIGLKFKSYYKAAQYATENFSSIVGFEYDPKKSYSKDTEIGIIKSLKRFISVCEIKEEEYDEYYFWLQIKDIFFMFEYFSDAVDFLYDNIKSITRFNDFRLDPKDNDMFHPKQVERIDKWYHDNKHKVLEYWGFGIDDEIDENKHELEFWGRIIDKAEEEDSFY